LEKLEFKKLTIYQVCDKKEGRKDTCFMDNPGGDIRYREMKESCNELPCPSKSYPQTKMRIACMHVFQTLNKKPVKHYFLMQ